MDKKKGPVMLMILDGWGIREMTEGNAVQLANTPFYDSWLADYERSVLDASGEAVGLTEGQMGNSEVGHLNLGAGRVVYQDISAIDQSIRVGEFQNLDIFQRMIADVRSRGSRVHLLGLLSDGGVHSHERQLYALLDMLAAAEVPAVVHVVTDGRDTPTNSGMGFVKKLEDYLQSDPYASIGSLSGRYYAMDRDRRWERTQRAFDVIVHHKGSAYATASEALQHSYDANVTDEFVEPVVIGSADVAIQPGDYLLCYNFRADRMRQIVQVLTSDVEGFGGERVPDLDIITFTVYEDDFPVGVVFGKDTLKNVLAEVLSSHNLRQYHSAETEKYPHVTFFFNGRREESFPGEDRRIIPSPKVATYDLKPEMSAYELTEATLARLKEADDDFLLINFANPDMVGHTGSLEAAIKAVEVVDNCAARLVSAVLEKGGVVLVTADHGNCERMIELSTGEAHTYHTTNPVSLILIGDHYYRMVPRGKLADVAPTVLDLLGVPKPVEMTGNSLIETGS